MKYTFFFKCQYELIINYLSTHIDRSTVDRSTGRDWQVDMSARLPVKFQSVYPSACQPVDLSIRPLVNHRTVDPSTYQPLTDQPVNR